MNEESKMVTEKLKSLLNDYLNQLDTEVYLGKKPVTRHESWLLATSLATLNMLEEIKNIRVLLEKLVDCQQEDKPKLKMRRK